MTQQDNQRAAFEAQHQTPSIDAIEQEIYAASGRFISTDAMEAVRSMIERHTIKAIAQDRQSRGEPVGWRDFIENIATPCSEPLNSVSGYSDKASRKAAMGELRMKAAELLENAPQPAEPVKGPSDCPHAAPHRYCSACVVSPCPVGLGGKK